MPLTTAAPTIGSSSLASKELLLEWLTSWFNGATKAIPNSAAGSAQVEYPQCRVYFDDHTPPQPSSGGNDGEGNAGTGCSIGVVIHTGARTAYRLTGNNLNRSQLRIDFWVRAKIAPSAASAETSDSMAETVANLLYGLLLSPKATKDLAAKGVTQLDPRVPATVTGMPWATRIIHCAGKLEVKVWD